MEVVIVGDEVQAGSLGADIIEQHVRAKPAAVIGLATGSSPLSIYRQLVDRVQAGTLSLAQCSAFLLDEYVGLEPGHPQAYRTVIDRELLHGVDIDPANVHGLDGLADDIAAVDRFQQSKEGQELLGVMKNRNLLGLAYWHNGMKQLSTNRDQLTRPEHVKGLKFRTAGAFAEILSEYFDAAPTVVPGSEVYAMMERQAIDATEWSGPSENQIAGLQETARYIMYPGPQTNAFFMEFAVKQETWDALPEDLQAKIEAAAQLATKQRVLEDQITRLGGLEPGMILSNEPGYYKAGAYGIRIENLLVVTARGVPEGGERELLGFENLTRVADFELVDSVPTGRATEVAIPDWLSDARTNRSLESVCIAPPASPIAGSTLLLTEDVPNGAGGQRATLLGVADRGDLAYRSGAGTYPADCAFLPDGDLLVLERGIALLAFRIRLVRVPATEVRPGATMQGELLLEAAGSEIDNMEGLAVHAGPDGSTRITMVSDDNFIDLQRTLLLQFSLPE